MRTEGTPHSAATVVVVGIDDDAMGIVRETLAADAVLPNKPVSYDEALEVTARTLPDVALVGLDDNRADALELCRAIKREFSDVLVVGVGLTRDADLIIEAMRSGISEYVHLPNDASQLRVAIQNAAYRPDDGERGIVVAVHGAKGGVGTTMIATHLAAELAAIHRVVVIDMDFNAGDLATQLDIITNDSIVELLQRGSDIDERALRSSVTAHKSLMHVISQPDDLDRIGEYTADDVFNVINAAALSYQFVIIDVGSTLDPGALTSLNVADQVFVVATPDVVAVRDAHRKLKTLVTIGLERDRLNLILNRMTPQPRLSIPNIETNLDVKVMATIAEDNNAVPKAVNDGKLVSEVEKRSPFATDVARLVGLLNADPEDVEALPVSTTTRSSGNIFSRLFGR